MNRSRPQFFGMLAGLFLSAGLVCSAALATSAWLKIRNSHGITVKGSARKNIRSDLGIWTGTFTAEAETLADAQGKLKSDRVKVEAFLAAAGMTNRTFGSITIEEVRAHFEYDRQANASRSFQDKTVGYRLKQTVDIRTSNVDRMSQLDADSASLVAQGVMLTADKPKYIYSKVAEEKIEMLAEATRDARLRAEQICDQGGARVAALQRADMGVFQITPADSVQTSWEGMNDTSSLDKTITAVVTATFALK